MFTRFFSRFFALALLSVLLMSASLTYADGPDPVTDATDAIAAPNAIGPSERFTIRATELLALDVQEAGDNEPYIVLGVIRPNGSGHRLEFFRTGTFSGVRDGDIRQMDRTLINNLNLTNNVTIVAQVIEHDETSVAAVADEMEFRAKVHFSFAVINGDTSVTSLRNAVAKGFSEGLKAVTAVAGGNDDDPIDTPIILTVTATEMDNLVVNETRTRTATASGNNAQFRLTFTIRRNA